MRLPIQSIILSNVHHFYRTSSIYTFSYALLALLPLPTEWLGLASIFQPGMVLKYILLPPVSLSCFWCFFMTIHSNKFIEMKKFLFSKKNEYCLFSEYKNVLIFVRRCFDYYWLYSKVKYFFASTLQLKVLSEGISYTLAFYCPLFFCVSVFMPLEYFIEYLHSYHNRIPNSSFQIQKQLKHYKLLHLQCADVRS